MPLVDLKLHSCARPHRPHAARGLLDADDRHAPGKCERLEPPPPPPLSPPPLLDVTDLSAVRGMPLTSLKLDGCPELTNLAPFADCKSLQSLTLPPNAKNIEFFRDFPKLERISFKEDTKNVYLPDKTAAEFWKEYDGQAWLRNLRASGLAIKRVLRLPDGTWDVDLRDSGISDLTILSGAHRSAVLT